jgi:hypothetical protein
LQLFTGDFILVGCILVENGVAQGDQKKDRVESDCLAELVTPLALYLEVVVLAKLHLALVLL